MQTTLAQRPQLLIIDDDEHIRALLVNVLSESYDCAQATSAEDALVAPTESHFDLVISDIQMGGMSGLELVPCTGLKMPAATTISFTPLT
ncbi:MAG TPA: response regulator [Pyrinomonadaceae bacterium]|nr:response regulator [Pyrinomonadaceae bacterium]